MARSGKIENKAADDPDPAYMHHCGEKELRRDSTAPDRINSSVGLSERDLDAVGVDHGDNVRAYIEANGFWVEDERTVYSDRAGIGLPRSLREDLHLEPQDTIEVWIEAVPEPEDPDSETDSAGSSSTRATDGDPYVWIHDNGSTIYHEVRVGDQETVCGIDYSDRDHTRLSDPGDVLDECSDCARMPSADVSNRELVEWIGDSTRADFEVDDDAPSYLNKRQLLAIRDYIFKLEDKLDAYQSQLDDYTIDQVRQSNG